MKGRIFIVTLAAAALLSSSAFAANHYGPHSKPQGRGLTSISSFGGFNSPVQIANVTQIATRGGVNIGGVIQVQNTCADLRRRSLIACWRSAS